MAIFTQQTGADNPFNGIDVDANSTPNFVDLDGDGDFDAVVGVEFGPAVDGNGAAYYFENTGTSLAPVFTQRTGAANPFDSIVGDNISTSLGDLDGDGDLDAVVGGLSLIHI